jgi:hypothetical protein
MWERPIYKLAAKNGKKVTIDVTSSVSAGLPPNKIVRDLIRFFRQKGVETILDFGAGALRHTFPLLNAGFQVCAVEFESQFRKPVCAESIAKARRHSNFCTLMWPHDFQHDKRRFDAALLCYVLQTMPVSDERKLVLKLLKKKLTANAYLLLMSRYGQLGNIPIGQAVRDGFYMSPDREVHSFYTEFTTENTHQMFDDCGLKRLRSLGERGTDQVFLYGKGRSTWI